MTGALSALRAAGALALFLALASVVPQARTGGEQGDPGTPVARGPGDVYLALGDSIAAGIGATHPDERGYPALVADYLDAQAGRRIERLNLAVPGETTASLIASGQLDEAVRFIDAARRSGRRVGPITVTVGANDLLRAGDDAVARSEAISSVAANLRVVFTRLREASDAEAGEPIADLVATSYYDPTGSDPALEGSDGWWLARLNAAIRTEIDHAGGRMADVSALFRDRATELTWYPDDVHPTNGGHRVIADAVWRTLGYDTTPPEVRLDRPDPGTLRRPIPTVAVVASDTVGVTEVTLAVDGVSLGPLPWLPELGAYAALWDARRVMPGSHRLEAHAADAAGNRATASIVVIVPAAFARVPDTTSPPDTTPAAGS